MERHMLDWLKHRSRFFNDPQWDCSTKSCNAPQYPDIDPSRPSLVGISAVLYLFSATIAIHTPYIYNLHGNTRIKEK
jgi:hypothetical protein